MEAAIGAEHPDIGSCHSIFDFGFSACRAGVQRLQPLAAEKSKSTSGQN
jgi:hypothetical protein